MMHEKEHRVVSILLQNRFRYVVCWNACILQESICANVHCDSPCQETRAIARARVHTCKTPSTSKKAPVPKSLSTVQSHMPNRNCVVATPIPVTVNFCFHNSALSCFSLKETFDILQQQETLYCG